MNLSYTLGKFDFRKDRAALIIALKEVVHRGHTGMACRKINRGNVVDKDRREQAAAYDNWVVRTAGALRGRRVRQPREIRAQASTTPILIVNVSRGTTQARFDCFQSY
jgi:hypothetical protein